MRSELGAFQCREAATIKDPLPSLSLVVLVWFHRPGPLVVAGRVSAVGLRRIAVDQRPQVHRMGGAADLVLDREKVPAISGINDVAKPVLVLVVFLGDQAALREEAVRTGEIRDVYLHMVTIEIALRPIGLAELQILILSHLRARDSTVAVFEFGLYPHDLRIEGANAFRSPNRYLEFDIGDAERDAPEARGIRLIAAHAVAPGTGRLDIVVVFAEPERGALALPGDGREPVEQRLAARADDPGRAPEDLRITGRHMKLVWAHIDPQS